MTYEKFELLLTQYRNAFQKVSELYDIGLNILDSKYNIGEDLSDILNTALSTHYNPEGVDWVSWFIYEAKWQEADTKYQAWDKDGVPIAYDLPSLWELLERDYTIY